MRHIVHWMRKTAPLHSFVDQLFIGTGRALLEVHPFLATAWVVLMLVPASVLALDHRLSFKLRMCYSDFNHENDEYKAQVKELLDATFGE